jgi:hypothetical protein
MAVTFQGSVSAVAAATPALKEPRLQPVDSSQKQLSRPNVRSRHAGVQALHVQASQGYLLEDLLEWLPSSRLEVYPVWQVGIAWPHFRSWDTQHLQHRQRSARAEVDQAGALGRCLPPTQLWQACITRSTCT